MSQPPALVAYKSTTGLIPLAAYAFFSAGCDPVVNVYGSFFPAWIVCLIVGIFLTAIVRWLFAITRLERHLGPLTLIYPALAFLLSAVVWLIFFKT